jgi:hypothetical protein
VLILLALSAEAWAQTPPATPTGLQVTCASASAVTVGWLNHSAAKGVRIERAEGLGPFAAIATATDCMSCFCPETNLYDQTTEPGRQYFYRVRGYRVKRGFYAWSAYSNVAVITTPTDTGIIPCGGR